MLSLLSEQFGSLVRELRFYKTRGVAKKKKYYVGTIWVYFHTTEMFRGIKFLNLDNLP